MRNILGIVVLAILQISCVGYVGVVVDNQSKDTIYAYENYIYPDTILPKETVHTKNSMTIIPDGESRDVLLIWDEYSTLFSKYDTIMFFLIRKNAVDNFTYEDIRKNNRILARYDLSLQDVEAFDGYFEYPPSQRMIDSGMKIYINPNNPDL